MGNRHLLHVKSSVVESNGKAKLPKKDDLLYGELAINYAKDKETLSLRNSADEIVPLRFSALDNINVNGVSGNVQVIDDEHIAYVVISGSDENVGIYQEVQYPEPFSGKASNVKGNITISSAFTNVEKTISALTQELIDDEIVVEKAIDALGNAGGIIDENGVIRYITNTNAKYINNAISLADADDILDAAIKNVDSRVENLENDYVNGATFNGTAVQVNNHKLVITATTDNIKYDSSTSSTTQVIDSISGDVNNLKIDVNILKQNSGHTVVSGDETYIHVTQNGRTYNVESKINGLKVGSDNKVYLTDGTNNLGNGVTLSASNITYNGTTNVYNKVNNIDIDVETLKENSGHTTVSAGDNVTVTQSDKNYQVSVDLSEYVTKPNITGDTPIIKVVGSGDTTVTSAKENNKITYTVTTDLSDYAKSEDVPTDLGVSANGLTRIIYLKKSNGEKVGSGATFEVGGGEEYYGNVSAITINNKTASSTTTGATSLSLTLSASDITYDGSVNVQNVISGISGDVKVIKENYISGGTIGASADGYSATVTNGVLNLTIPETAAPHIPKGGRWIEVEADDTINWIGSGGTAIVTDDATHLISFSGDLTMHTDKKIYIVDKKNNSRIGSGVAVHGHDVVVDSGFTTTTYPTGFTNSSYSSSVSSITTADTINSALTKVERTVSALTQALLDDEDIWATAVQNVCNAAGSIVNNDNKIEYIPDQSCAYIKQATSLHSADAILDQKIVELEFKIGQIIKVLTQNGASTTSLDEP